MKFLADFWEIRVCGLAALRLHADILRLEGYGHGLETHVGRMGAGA